MSLSVGALRELNATLAKDKRFRKHRLNFSFGAEEDDVDDSCETEDEQAILPSNTEENEEGDLSGMDDPPNHGDEEEGSGDDDAAYGQ